MPGHGFDRDINFINPSNALILPGQRWEDNEIQEIDYTSAENADGSTLDPGEELTAVEAVTSDPNTWVAFRAGATTTHAADLDGDSVNESIIRYRYEIKPQRLADTYHTLNGLSSTLSLGEMGYPEEFVPGSYIGPAKAFRVVFENRADEFNSSESVSVDQIGCHIHGRLVRSGENERPVQPTEFWESINTENER